MKNYIKQTRFKNEYDMSLLMEKKKTKYSFFLNINNLTR